MRRLSIAVLLGCMASSVSGQTLVPATTEDLREFDRQVARRMKQQPANHAHAHSAFGAQVSEEARRLKDQGQDSQADFGNWVATQRGKSDQGRPSAGDSTGSDNGKGGSADGPPGPTGSSHGNGNGGNGGTKPGKQK